MDRMRYSRWVCPRCETVNRGNFCTACGERRSMSGFDTRRLRTLLPEGDILGQAHRVAITRVYQTVPFFVLALILTGVIGFVFGLLLSTIIPFLGLFAGLLSQIFLSNIFEYGEHIAGLRLYRDKDISIGTLFEGMHDYGRVLCGMFWYKLRRGLWMLVPIAGIMKSYSYFFTPYILYEKPNLSPEEAIQESARITEGHKMELFVRDLKFTGWRILNLLSFGIVGVTYYFAYYDAVWGGFYDAAKPNVTRRRVTRYDYDEETPAPGSESFPSNEFIPPDPL